MKQARHNPKRSAGLTLVELTVTLAVIAIVGSFAVPTFDRFEQKRRLMSATEKVFTELTSARSQATKRQANVDVTFTADGSTTWNFTTSRDGKAKTISSSQYPEVAMALPSFGGNTTLTFAFVRRTAENGTVVLSTDNYETKVIVSDEGRIRVCSDKTGAKFLGRYENC